jgi:hypothetical protein
MKRAADRRDNGCCDGWQVTDGNNGALAVCSSNRIEVSRSIMARKSENRREFWGAAVKNLAGAFGNGLCSAVTSLTGASSQISNSSGFVKTTGIALA